MHVPWNPKRGRGEVGGGSVVPAAREDAASDVRCS